jgi:hypothetical protein
VSDGPCVKYVLHLIAASYTVPKDNGGKTCDTDNEIGFSWYHPYQGNPSLVDHTLGDVDSAWHEHWQRHLERSEGDLPQELARLLYQCEYVRIERAMFTESAQITYTSNKNNLPLYIIGDTHILNDGCETAITQARILSDWLDRPVFDLEQWIQEITEEAIRASQSFYGLEPSSNR